MKPPSRTTMLVLFAFWMLPLAAAAYARPEYIALEYARDWLVTQAILGLTLYVTGSIAVSTIRLARKRGPATTGA